MEYLLSPWIGTLLSSHRWSLWRPFRGAPSQMGRPHETETTRCANDVSQRTAVFSFAPRKQTMTLSVDCADEVNQKHSMSPNRKK